MVRPIASSIGVSFAYGVRYKSGVIHKGVDFSDGKEGHTVISCLDGTVTHAGYGGWGPAYGQHVIIKSTFAGKTKWVLYGHLKTEIVSVGQKVKAGQKIGTSGGAAGKKYSGNSTGPHLHVQVGTANVYTKYEDPWAVINSGAAPTPPARVTAVWGKPATWRIGSIGPDVTRLGQQLEKWAKHYGLPKPYTVGPSPEFTETDRRAVEAFQRKQGWTGANADGFPGTDTFKRLAVDPSTKAPVSKIAGLHWNVADSDTVNGYKKENGTRGPAVGAHATAIGYDVFLTCESGQDNLRKGIDSVLSPPGWSQHAKTIWYKPANVNGIARRKSYADTTFNYLKSKKYGAAFFGEKDGHKFSVLEIHTDYRKPAKQAKQVQSIFRKWRTDTDALGIDHRNCYVVGDLNPDGSSGDNPFNALTAWNFVEKGSRTAHTFMERSHFDGVLAHRDADVTVTVEPRANSKGVRLSDHNPVKFTAALV